VLLQREEGRLPEAGEPEGQARGVLSGADPQVPRRRQRASVREGDREKIAAEAGVFSQRPRELPDWFGPVGKDVIEYCRPEEGLWVDLGCGSGGLGFALAGMSQNTIVLIDPDADALGKAVQKARESGLTSRVIPIVGCAECLPLPDESVDVVVSRGSFYFWQDRAQGLREVWRVLRPGGRAMIGGGLGRRYPQWARQEFIRRRRESVAAKGPEAVREFVEARSPETFRRLAVEAGLPAFEVVGEGGLGPDEANTGIGIWLQMAKEAAE